MIENLQQNSKYLFWNDDAPDDTAYLTSQWLHFRFVHVMEKSARSLNKLF